MINYTMDKDFFNICIPLNKKTQHWPGKSNEFFIHAGYINFLVGNVTYAIPDYPAFQKYLEHRGYTYNPRTDVPIKSFSNSDSSHALYDLGPGARNQRIIQFFTNSVLHEKFEKEINSLQTFDEIKNYLYYHVGNNVHLSPYTYDEYLRTGVGRYSILDYARYYGLDHFDIVEEYIIKNFGPDCAFNISRKDMNPFEHFQMQLERISFDFFKELLEKANIEKAKRKEGTTGRRI